MAKRESVKLLSRQERLARALAALTMGVGGILIAVAFIVQPSTAPKEATPTPASADKQAEPKQEQALAPALPAPTEPKPAAATPPAVTTTQTEQTTPVTTTVTDTKPPTEPAVTVTESKPEPQKPAENKPAEKPAEPAATVAEAKPEPQKPEQEESSSGGGWIYAGQFVDGQWLERGLVIDNELPASGKRYALNWGANVRSTPPGKDTSLSKTVSYLPQGQQVEIEQVKRSGNKGHVWLKIK